MNDLYNTKLDERIPSEANSATDYIFDENYTQETTTDHGFHSALLVLSKRIGFDLKMPDELIGSFENNLQKTSIASGFQFQKVILNDENWWEMDNGPLLAFHHDSQKFYALLPTSSGGYKSHHANPIKINQETARQFESAAYSLYLPFPDKSLNIFDVLKLSLGSSKLEIISILSSQIILGIIALLMPLFFGGIVDSAIPLSDKNMLGQIIFGLIAATLCGLLLTILQAIAFLRLKLKSTTLVESALWERLLRLPLSFFRQFGVGELISRIKGLDSIFLSINANFLKTIFNGIWAILSIVFIFFYDFSVAWLILGMTLLMSLLTVTSSFTQLYFNKKIAFIDGRSSNLLVEMISSIKKIRTTNTESIFFKKWLTLLISQLKNSMKSNTLMIVVKSIEGYIMIITTVLIYIHFLNLGTEVTLGTFITTNALMGTFMAAFLGFSSSLMSYVQLIPQYDRIKPILNAIPESREQENTSYPLTNINEIRLKNISFSYEKTFIQTLCNINMNIHKGEFIAVVGCSGSGKSTLVRLLLGLETPQEGKILYNGIDINQMSLQWIRSQCGVVLQTTNLMSGSLFDNITGFNNALTEKDVLRAIRLANLTADIEALPMGLQTVVMDQGVGFSQGQRQRILIARALCHNPQILILDEATSALDSLNQSIIYENLNQQNMTRIVIAHRLSTIEQADVIYVLDKGKIVESGNYKELIELNGFFSKMVHA